MVQVVDPREWSVRLKLLVDAAVDVPHALSSGQLVINTWDEVMPRDGGFDARAILGFLRRSLDDGRRARFPLTRLVLDMDRAVEGPPSTELLAYERQLDGILRRRADLVVCAYHLDRHDTGTVLDLLGAHQAAVIGGVVRSSGGGPGGATAPPRERLLTAAADLFGDHGIAATGVDAIASAAGVAKATLYRHFASKDDLVVAWLMDPRTRWLDEVRRRAESDAATPAGIISGFFDALAIWLEAGDFRGCPYLNATAEITDPDHPALEVARDFMRDLGRYLQNVVALDGIGDAERLATRLHTLVAGAIALSVCLRSTEPTAWGRDAATALVAEATAGRT
jgi:AcrR family transcriptional regulator